MRTPENDTIETELPLDGWIVAWSADGDNIRVGRLGDNALYYSRKYEMVDGCCESSRHGMTRDQQIAMMFINFHTIVVRDKVDPQAAHREFMKIGEYRRCISPDIEGEGGL